MHIAQFKETVMNHAPDVTRKYIYLTLASICVFAIAFNTVLIRLDPPTITSGETRSWWPTVENLADGKGYTDCNTSYDPACSERSNHLTAMHEPIPVIIFALLVEDTPMPLYVAAIIELVMNVLVTLLIFALAKELAGSRAGLVAALFWSVYLPAATLVPQVSGELSATLFVTLGMLFFIYALRKQKYLFFVIAGISLGLAALSRSALLVVFLVLVMGSGIEWIRSLLTKNADASRQIKSLIVFSLAAVMTISPWFIRNYLVFHEPVIGTTLVGYNLYRNNYQLANNTYRPYVGIAEAKQAVQELGKRNPALYSTASETQTEDLFLSAAKQIILTYPGRYIAISLYRFLPLWFDLGVNQAYGYRMYLSDWLMILQQGLLLVLAFVSLRRTKLRYWPLVLSIVAVTASYMAVVSQLRYIVTVMPMVVTLAAIGFLKLIGHLRRMMHAKSLV